MNILRYAFKNIFRNWFLSLSSIITIGLLVFFVNILLLVVISADAFSHSVNNKIAIMLTFQDDYNENKVRTQEFLAGAKSQFPWIDIEYISKEKALEIFSKRHSDLASIIEDATDNPLPNSVRISGIPLKMYEQVDAYMARYRDILKYDEQDMNKKLLDYQLQYRQVVKIVKDLALLKNAVFILIGLFLFTASVVIHSVIRNFIFFMQDEVRIIELVGWKSSFIYGPLMVQGVFYTVSAVAIAFSFFYIFQHFGGLATLPSQFIQTFSYFYAALSNEWIFAELLIAISVGIISAFIASFGYVHSTIRE